MRVLMFVMKLQHFYQIEQITEIWHLEMCLMKFKRMHRSQTLTKVHISTRRQMVTYTEEPSQTEHAEMMNQPLS